MDIINLLIKAHEINASDLHLTADAPPVFRVDGRLQRYGDTILTGDIIKAIVNQILDESQQQLLHEQKELDVAFNIPNIARFRINIYIRQGYYTLAARVINIKVPTLDQLGFPDSVKDMVMKHHGLILVTGPTGSGKSTTLAAMIDYINSNRNCHILTLEDPIEYVHCHKNSIVNQRQIGSDTQSFVTALRAALREDPDVILVGEMRDIDTISTAITAAETGHLVMSTLHTIGADQTIDRIIDAFPAHQQAQIRTQLSGVLQGIISQQLIPRASGAGRIAALEIMIPNSAIKNLIREGKTHQLKTSIQTGTRTGMCSMDYYLSDLVRKKLITMESALDYAFDPEMLKRYLSQW